MLRRLVIPKEVRKNFNIDGSTALEIFIDGNGIILSKYYEKCVICIGINDLKKLKTKN